MDNTKTMGNIKSMGGKTKKEIVKDKTGKPILSVSVTALERPTTPPPAGTTPTGVFTHTPTGDIQQQERPFSTKVPTYIPRPYSPEHKFGPYKDGSPRIPFQRHGTTPQAPGQHLPWIASARRVLPDGSFGELNSDYPDWPQSALLRIPSYRRNSRSLPDTDGPAAVAASPNSDADFQATKERLLSEGTPKSLDEAREDARVRRASIAEQEFKDKVDRKAFLGFIRTRTNSRAAQLGLSSPTSEEFPALEENVPLQFPACLKRENDVEPKK